MELTLKETTTIVLLAQGSYQTPQHVIKHLGKANTGWNFRLSEQGYIRSANGLYGLDARWALTPLGWMAFSRLSPRQIYEAKNRLRRMGYHLPDDPIPAF